MKFWLQNCVVFRRFLCVVPAVLELSLYTSLASNPQKSTCLHLPSAGIKDIHHYCLAWQNLLGRHHMIQHRNNSHRSKELNRKVVFYFILGFEARRGVKSPRTGVTTCCELLCGFTAFNYWAISLAPKSLSLNKNLISVLNILEN